MAKRLIIKRLFLLMSATGIIGFNQSAMAAAYQLWEQDGASIGNYHAGIAAAAEDASTAFYNPAGLIRIKNQQLVIGGDPVLTNFRYRGTVAVSTLNNPLPQPVTAQGGGFNFVPFGHYAAPINNNLVFGLSVVVPFGLKTNYGSDTILRYAATLTEVKVIDLSPSLGIAFNDKFSIGFGFDAERMNGNFNQFATAISTPANDTESTNGGSDTAYGYHLGALYQMNPETRFGISFHSHVVHHLTGSSTFSGPLANNATGGSQYSNNLKTTTTLPPTTSVSIFHTINPKWDVMGSISYTQWSVFKNLTLQNVAGVDENFEQSNQLQIIVGQNYRSSWNYSIGTNYHVNEQWMLRGGLGYDETPSNNQFRNVQLPDSDRIALALGGHFQASQTVALDVGWTHIFSMNSHINNLAQTVGPETVTTNGTTKASADVYGFQLKWDIT